MCVRVCVWASPMRGVGMLPSGRPRRPRCGEKGCARLCEMACYFVATKNTLMNTLCADTGKIGCKAGNDALPCCMGTRREDLPLPEGGALACVFPVPPRKRARQEKKEEVDPIEYADWRDGGLENMEGGGRTESGTERGAGGRADGPEPVLKRDGCGSEWT